MTVFPVRPLRTLMRALAVAAVCAANPSHAETIAMSSKQIQAAGVLTSPVLSSDSGVQAVSVSGVVRSASGSVVAVNATEDLTVVQVIKPNLSQIKKGDAVVRVNSAALINAQQQLLSQAANARLERQNLQRDQALLADGLIPQKRVLETQARDQVAQLGLQSARQTLLGMGLSAGAIQSLEKQGVVKPWAELSAPAAGQVNSLNATAGQRVMAGQLLFQVQGQGNAELWLNASAQQAARVHIGDTVEVPGCKSQGTVQGVGQGLNAETQAVDIRVTLNDKSSNCLPLNQVVQATVNAKSTQKGLQVPASAVLSTGGKRWVFVQRPDGFEPVEVQVFSQTTELASIAPKDNRLNLGEQLVATRGLAFIKGAWRGLGAE